MNNSEQRIGMTEPYPNPVHEALREIVQRMYAEHGVRVQSIDFAWIPRDQINDPYGPDDMVRISQVRVIRKTDGNHD